VKKYEDVVCGAVQWKGMMALRRGSGGKAVKVFTHLLTTIFRVEFLWRCFVHFVGSADDVVPVGCARISVIVVVVVIIVVVAMVIIVVVVIIIIIIIIIIFGLGGMFWALPMIGSLFLMCSDILLEM
jgi:hypothetical protein